MAPSPKPMSVAPPRKPKATHNTTVPTPIQTGMTRRCHNTAPLILRQLSTGATAIRNNKVRPAGMATVLKNGAPTVTCCCVTAS